MRPSLVRDHGQLRGLGMPLDVCTREIASAAAELFGLDPQIASVGIIRIADGYGFGVRRFRAPGVVSLRRNQLRGVEAIRDIAIEVHELSGPIRPQIEIAAVAANAPLSATTPQQGRVRPLSPGVQLQNWDADARWGRLDRQRFVVGSLGMVIERDGERLLISNNHVLADQNRGRIGDRIAQPGGARLAPDEVVARLERFVPLQTSPPGAHPSRGTVRWNRVDAAFARVDAAVDCITHMGECAQPRIGERVFKIGRTTGLRWGVITSIGERVGPVSYAIGNCWFSGSFVIEGEGGRPFSDGGDSGAVVMRVVASERGKPRHEAVGLIYAGNGVETYACPIADVLARAG